MQLRLSTKAASAENVGQGHISQRVLLSYYQTDLNQMFFMNDEASTLIVTLMCEDLHFFTLDNCLLYIIFQ